MKLKTTKTAIKNNFNKIVKIGYCDAQYLLNYKKPFGYSSGINGWACDYYEIGHICISTGYNPIGKNLDYKILKQAEAEARSICLDFNKCYEAKENELNVLLTNLLKTI